MAELTARDTCARSIRKLLAYTMDEQFENQTKEELETRLSYLGVLFDRFSANHGNLLAAEASDEERDAHQTIFDEIEEVFLNVHSRLLTKINSFAPAAQKNHEQLEHEQAEHSEPEEEEPSLIENEEDTPQMCNTPQRLPYQLPQIIVQMPDHGRKENTWGEFDGEDLSKWPGFRDRFRAAVHEDKSISNAYKLQYLKGSLKGKAAAEFGEWPSTDENYLEGWEFLEQRYNRPHHSTKEILWKFLNLPKLERASGYMIQKLSNVTNECMRQLRALKYPVKHFDLFFVHGLHDRLDPETSKAWELGRTSESPAIQDMISFLNRQAKALTGVQFVERKGTKRLSNLRDGASEKKKARFDKEKEQKKERVPMEPPPEPTECKLCENEKHPMHRCAKFRAMTLAERKKHAREQKVCMNCLRPSHFSKDCPLKACFRCNVKHNSLLCHENPKNKTVATVQLSKSEKRKST